MTELRSDKVDLSILDQWIEQHKEQLIQDVCDAVRIKSVAQREDSSCEPYRKSCGRALDLFQKRFSDMGMETTNDNYYYVTGLTKGSDRGRSIGVFGHADVVPEGNGWSTEPYEPVVRDGYIYGRGSADNKGPMMSVLYALRCLQENGVRLRSDVQVFAGSCEECGMEDIEQYAERNQFPDFSLVPDVKFPVCNGEKGILSFRIGKKVSMPHVAAVHAGCVINMIPDSASIVIKNLEPEKWAKELSKEEAVVSRTPEGFKAEFAGIGGHAAFPENSKNAVGVMCKALHRLDFWTPEEQDVFSMIEQAAEEFYGRALQIAFEDQPSGKTTHILSILNYDGKQLEMGFNIRYAVTQSSQAICDALKEYAQKLGFEVLQLEDNPPFFIPADHPIVEKMRQTVQEVLGLEDPAYIMGGGTYSRKIKNAVGFGPGNPKEKHPGWPTAGEGHQPDECVKVADLLNAAKIYVRALIRLDCLLYKE